MTPARRSHLAALFAAAMLLGAPAAIAQYQPRPAQLPAGGERGSRPARADSVPAVQPGDSEQACQRRWQEYRRSQECFAPYRTVNGMKPEAFQACGKELRDPSAECGPPDSQ